MAPIQSVLTSALLLSAAIAAPISRTTGDDVAASMPSETRVKHHGEPMHKASPVMSRVPSGSFDTQAMQSSALAAAAHPSSSQNDGVFSVLENLPLGQAGEKERRQLDELTRFLTKLNQMGKRDEVEARQLGAIKSAPEALGQLGSLAKLAEGLPIKREDGDNFGGLTEIADLAKGAGKGAGAGAGAAAGAAAGTGAGLLAELETRGEKESGVDYAKSGATMLKAFHGMLHGSSKAGHTKAQKAPSATDTLGLGQLASRSTTGGSGDIGGLGGLGDILGGIAKRASDSAINDVDNIVREVTRVFDGIVKREDFGNEGSAVDGLVKRKGGSGLDALSGITKMLGGLAKRDSTDGDDGDDRDGMIEDLDERAESSDPVGAALNGLLARWAVESATDMVDELAKRGGSSGLDGLGGIGKLGGLDKLIGGLAKRQLGIVNGLAKGALSNLGKSTSDLGKLATGKLRRNDDDGSGFDQAAVATIPLAAKKHKDSNNDDDLTIPDEIAGEVATGKEAAEEAKEHVDHFPSDRDSAEGPLSKRQVPPLAGSDLPSIAKALIANPKQALAPVTEGVQLAGTGIGSLFKE